MKLQEKKREMKKERKCGFSHLLKQKFMLLMSKNASVNNYEKRYLSMQIVSNVFLPHCLLQLKVVLSFHAMN